MVSMSIQSMVRPISDSLGSTMATLFSSLQAATQPPQPVHFCRSITIPHFIGKTPSSFDLLHPDERRPPRAAPAQRIRPAVEHRERIRPHVPGVSPRVLMPLANRNRQDFG